MEREILIVYETEEDEDEGSSEGGSVIGEKEGRTSKGSEVGSEDLISPVSEVISPVSGRSGGDWRWSTEGVDEMELWGEGVAKKEV